MSHMPINSTHLLKKRSASNPDADLFYVIRWLRYKSMCLKRLIIFLITFFFIPVHEEITTPFSFRRSAITLATRF